MRLRYASSPQPRSSVEQAVILTQIRKDAAERVASYQMRETLIRVTATPKARPDSRVLPSGYSMRGVILTRTLAPTVSSLLLAPGPEGTRTPAERVVLQNPALDGLAAFQLVDDLTRTGAQLEHRRADGSVKPARTSPQHQQLRTATFQSPNPSATRPRVRNSASALIAREHARPRSLAQRPTS